MKNIFISLSLILFLVNLSCSKKDDPSPDPKKDVGDTIQFLSDEIPVDTAGNFDFKKVSTTNQNLLKDSTVSLYLNYQRDEYGGMDRIRTLNCDYLYINQSGDTIFNPYSMVFTPNAYQNHINTYDMQFKVDDYKKVDVFGAPIFDGNREFVNMDREYGVEKNILKVAQYAVSDIVSFKIICIQKDEKYLKAIIIGAKRNYLLKILISRYDDATKQFIGGYNGITYENSIERITRLRKEKQIFDANITTLDMSEKKIDKVRF